MASDKLFYFLFQSIPEICAMGGITLEDLSQSKAYQEIFGLGEAREATTSSIQALLDLSGPGDLTAWLAAHS